MRNLVLGSNSVRGKKKRRNIRKFVIRNAEIAVQTIRRRALRMSATTVGRACGLREAVRSAASEEGAPARAEVFVGTGVDLGPVPELTGSIDRKSTRLNSSHRCISYA